MVKTVRRRGPLALVTVVATFLALLLAGTATSYAAGAPSKVPAHTVSANVAVTPAAAFPFPCNKMNLNKKVVVGGTEYVCVCVVIDKSEPCQYVWKNTKPSETSFATLEMDHGVAISAGAKATLYFQPDNNLVVYDENGRPRWASNTVGKGAVVKFQPDGNFVVYNGSGKPTWASNTCCHSGNRLNIQADGNVVIYASSGGALWATNTGH